MRRAAFTIAVLAAAALVTLIVHLITQGGFLLHPLGYCQGTPHQQMLCKGYNSWSGILGSIATNVPQWLVAGLLIYWHHTCANPRCWRPGRFPTADGLHKLCRVCHPDLPNHRLSLAEIHERHHAAKAPL